MINKTPFIQKICTFFAFYLAVSSVFPPIRTMSGYNVFSIIVMFSWIACAFVAKPTFFTIFAKDPLHKQVVIFFVAYTTIVPYLFGNGIIGNRYLTYGQVLIFYFIYQYNRTYGYKNSSKTIIKWSVMFIITTSALTLFGLINNPYLSRSIKSSGEYTTSLQSQGIGGFEFIYFSVFLATTLFFLIINKNSLDLQLHKKIAIYSLFTLTVFTVIYSNYFTALIMLTMSLLILVITKANAVSRIITLIIGAIVLVQGKSNSIGVINWASNNLSSGKTLDRVLLIQADLMGFGNESLLSGRIPTFEESWNAFLNNPFFGIALNKIEFDDGYLKGFGQHSHFLDTFALYGLFIGLIGIYIIAQPFLKRMKVHTALFGLNVSILASVLMLFSANNVTPSIGYAVFFIYPVLYDWQVDRTKAKTKENEKEIREKASESIAS